MDRDSLEKRLQEYGSGHNPAEKEERIRAVIDSAKESYYDSLQGKTVGWGTFLWGQAAYIRKRWWILQMLLLALLWWILCFSDSSYLAWHSCGVLAPAFVILLIPELFKNKSSQSVEIEGAAYYSLRQLYAARFFLFVLVDTLLLGLFTGAVLHTVQTSVWEMIIHFYLPLNVTCGICFGTLCSKRMRSEYAAVGFSLIWIAVWLLIVLDEKVYRAVSGPVWIGAVAASVLFFTFAVYRTLKNCGSQWEEEPAWN